MKTQTNLVELNVNDLLVIDGSRYAVAKNSGRGLVEIRGGRGAMHALCVNVHSGRVFLVKGTRSYDIDTFINETAMRAA